MEWKTGLPEKSGYYVCLTNYLHIVALPYSEKHNSFNAYDSDTKERANRNSLNEYIVNWIELAEFLQKQGFSNEETN